MLSMLPERIDRACQRDRGSITISVLAIVIVLFALAAGVTQLSTVAIRASATSNLDMRLFYLADSGAQIGNAIVRANPSINGNNNFEESIGGGTLDLNIKSQGANGITVTSTGTIDGQQKTIEMVIKVNNDGYQPQGAGEMIVDNGVELEGGGLPIELRDTSTISGQDHAADGTLLAGQSGATHGLAMTDTPGSMDFSVSQAGGATLEGTPAATMNEAANQRKTIQTLRSYARYNADISLSGSRTLNDTHTGSYGTALAPVLVYVRLGEENTLTLSQGFSGYGTLFIDVREAEEYTSLRLMDTASWHGPVVVNFRGEAEIEGGAAIKLEGSSSIIGGLMVNLTGEEVEIEDNGKLLRTSGTASLLYSSEATSFAPGFSDIGTTTVEIVSYRSL